MAEPITDEFAMASGIAALVLMQVTLEQMQELGLPSSKIDEIITRSLQIIAAVSANQYHSSLPISAKLLREMLHKRQSMRKSQPQAMH
jgi:hypothetical protein